MQNEKDLLEEIKLLKEQIKKINWNDLKYNEVVDIFRQKLPWLGEGKQGFAPI